MALGNVRHFVGNDRSELGLAFGRREEAREHADMSPRACKSIQLGIFDQVKREAVCITGQCRRQPAPNLL